MHKSIKKWSVLAAGLTLVAVIAAACQPASTTGNDNSAGEVAALQTQLAQASEGGADTSALETQVADAQATIDAQEAMTEEAPTEAVGVDRHGGWFDTIVIVEEPDQNQGVERMLAGDIDIYMYATGDPEIYKKITDNADKLNTVKSVGNYNEILFNPSGPTFANGELNPFSDAVVREAMNWLIDRDYISQEIYGGLAQPRYTAIGTASSDYVTYIDLVRAIESKYAYNPDKANEVISAEMESMGATMDNGKWMFNDEPVTVHALIRIEDKRKDIGDYVSNQLESIGFTVDRLYKSASDASACWVRTDSTEGCYSFYTSGWISTSISRDEGSNFGFFYTPLEGITASATNYQPSEEFNDVANKLWTNDFSTLDERRDLFDNALTMSLENSQRVFLVDQITVTAFNNYIEASGDLAGGINGSTLWAYTIRRAGQVGGSLNVAMPSILTEPWNPVAGSNWVYDAAIQRASGESATEFDPFTGLSVPHRLDHAEVVVEAGTPVGQTLDWVTLTTADSIEVPADAWGDWDAASQTFIPVGEGVTAKTKTTVYYPDDLFDTVTWHDGSKLSMGDFILYMITNFDLGKEDSPYYDPAQTPSTEAFLSHFKGVKIVSTSPLVIETYDDGYALDAENMAAGRAWWPTWAYGEAPWHTMAIGLLAEGNGEAAFSPDKSAEKEVEQTSFLAGPTIDILTADLEQATADGFIPYAPTMGEYVTADEASARYANLAEWVRRYGHFWVNTGPYFVQKAFPVEGTVILKENASYSDLADRWSAYSTAPIPSVTLDGNSQITIGDKATFTAMITFNDEPYAAEDLKQVIYLVYDAEGNLVMQGEATGGDGGAWTVEFDTADLPEGSNKVEVVAVSNRVGLPVFASQQFVTSK